MSGTRSARDTVAATSQPEHKPGHSACRVQVTTPSIYIGQALAGAEPATREATSAARPIGRATHRVFIEDCMLGIEQIARVCHEVNRAYCQSIGDDSQPEWNDAPDWQKDSAMNGVRFHMENPGAGPEASHVKWLEQKKAEGWEYGPVKDPVKKQHPCFVAYNFLPIEQRAKDYIFRQIVHSLLDVVVV